MNRSKVVSVGLTTAVLATLLASSQIALAGTPLICFPFDIGTAKSLPWRNDPFDAKAGYDLSRLVEDTEALLTADTPVIVRMETLRRATLYGQKDPKIAQDLLAKLKARAQEVEAKGRPDALAWFDLGYLIETYKQAHLTWKKLPSGSYDPVFQQNAASDLDGYALVRNAIRLRGQDPQMEFAAAEITAWPRQKSYDEHLRKAMAGAMDGSLLAKNLATHFGAEVKKAAGLRAQAGSPKD